MKRTTETAPAKLNLTLDVTGRRPDGYHEIASVEQTVSLYDDVEVCTETGGTSVFCTAQSGENGLPQNEENLAWKAAELFFRETGVHANGFAIRIFKRIPSQAGMGGGSADAAAVLRALNRLCGEPADTAQLCRIGGLVGADVPFCIVGGACEVRGIGERVRPLPPAPKLHFVICKPPFPVSTPELYRKIDEMPILRHPDTAAMCEALQKNDASAVGALLENVFEPLVAQEHPEIEAIRRELLSLGALGARMTGSGSAVFGIFSSEKSAQNALLHIKTQYSLCFAAESV